MASIETIGMCFDKAYKEYLAWRLDFIQKRKGSDIGFDRLYFESMSLE